MAKKEKQVQAPVVEKEEMTLEEAKAYRAAAHAKNKKGHTVVLTENECREEFRKFWAMHKSKFGKGKDLEPIVWTHLKAIGMTHPAQFDKGLEHFGLKKV